MKRCDSNLNTIVVSESIFGKDAGFARSINVFYSIIVFYETGGVMCPYCTSYGILKKQENRYTRSFRMVEKKIRIVDF